MGKKHHHSSSSSTSSSEFESTYPSESGVDIHENSPEKELSLEHYRLAGRKPLPTLVYLSIGPVIAQVTGGLKGIIGSIWVSQALGDKALAAISTIGLYDGISRSFGFFLSTAGASKISQLYGQSKEEEASQVVVDLVRISIIFGIVVPLVLGLTTYPLTAWFGADKEIQDLSHQYMLPINIGTFTTILFIALGGTLQGEGRSLFFSVLNVIALAVNMVVLDPILLLWIRTGIWGASFAQAFSEAVPGVIIFAMYFMGKFGVKPKWSQFIKKFSVHTWPSLKVGFSALISNLSQIVPSIIIRKFMGLAFGERYNDGMAGFNTVIRIAIFTNSVIIALTMGFVPSGAYAYAAKNYRRWSKLAWHSLWMSTVWGIVTCILTWAIPRQLSQMFSSSEGYLELSTPMLQYSNALGFLSGGRFCSIAFLQSLQLGLSSTFLSLLSNFVSIIAFGCLLYYTDKTDGVRIIWCFSITTAFGFVLGFVFLISPVWKMYKEYKNMPKESVEKKSHSLSEIDPESSSSNSKSSSPSTSNSSST